MMNTSPLKNLWSQAQRRLSLKRGVAGALLLAALGMAQAQSFQAGSMVAQVDGSDCALCVSLAQTSLRKLPGVGEVLVDPAHHVIAVALDGSHAVEAEALMLLVNRSGYAVRKISTTSSSLAQVRASLK